MTKRDYLVIASVLRKNKPRIEIGTNYDPCWAWQKLCLDMAEALSRENPRFNADVFIAAVNA